MIESKTKQTILIVDDTPENIDLLTEALAPHYCTRAAINGEKALKIAFSGEPPDLILLDIMMPGMDGYEVCKRLKDNPGTQRIPVIFITARSDEGDEELGLNLGAVDYITKPFSLKITKARVRNHLRLKQQFELLEAISMVDALTQIPNRRRFDEAIDAEWKRAAREGTPLSVLMVDIDHFKEYNDHYGHGAGDDCLCAVATALQSGISRPGDMVTRYGGEEFAVILPETGKEAAAHIALRLCECVFEIKLPHANSSTEPFVTVSVGCATAMPSEKADSPRVLFDEADKMLYEAKGTGRNRVCSVVCYSTDTPV